jgi:hypothetical protein
MRGFLYQYTKFELITILEQYQDYVARQSMSGLVTVEIDDVESFIEKFWEHEDEPKENE